jgi:hypothetical protein
MMTSMTHTLYIRYNNITDHNTSDLNTTRPSIMTKRKMTQRQKIKYFQSDEGGGAAIDKVNEFISSPKIRAINVSVHPKAICILYEELE